MNTLKISGLTKIYPNGVKAMDHIDLDIPNGMFGLLGPNGAGKSTLMRTIATLQKPTKGQVKFNGVDILQDPQYLRKQLGYLPQEFGVYPGISAYRLMDHLAILKGVTDRHERKQQILQLLQQTNLQDHRHKAVSGFSGGMRQRFGIAQALLGDPKIIIVDEPTAGLDPEERHRFNNLLSEIGEQVVVLLSTHIVEDVEDLCTRVAIIAAGKVILQGEPSVLVTALRGTIWSKTITKAELPEYTATYNVISSRLNAGKLNIHVSSPTQPTDGFVAATPDLEDVYFHCLSLQQSKTLNYAD